MYKYKSTLNKLQGTMNKVECKMAVAPYQNLMYKQNPFKYLDNFTHCSNTTEFVHR